MPLAFAHADACNPTWDTANPQMLRYTIIPTDERATR